MFGGGGFGGMGGARGGGGSGGADNRIRRRSDPFDDARKANERRRDKIDKGYERRRRRTMRQISSQGAAGMADIDNEFTGIASGATQDLASRGLSGTTIAPTVQTAIGRDKGAAIGGLRERLAGLRAQYESDLSGDRLGFLERIEEEYPDYGY